MVQLTTFMTLLAIFKNNYFTPRPVVKVPGVGKVRGTTVKSALLRRNIYGFWGVPYALPPTGSRRFQPPSPAPPISRNLLCSFLSRLYPHIYKTETGVQVVCINLYVALKTLSRQKWRTSNKNAHDTDLLWRFGEILWSLVRVGLNCRWGLSLCLAKQWTIKKEETITK